MSTHTPFVGCVIEGDAGPDATASTVALSQPTIGVVLLTTFDREYQRIVTVPLSEAGAVRLARQLLAAFGREPA